MELDIQKAIEHAFRAGYTTGVEHTAHEAKFVIAPSLGWHACADGPATIGDRLRNIQPMDSTVAAYIDEVILPVTVPAVDPGQMKMTV